jgi:hypothetical protein
MHTGSIDGMCAIIRLVPDNRLGVYVLENLDHAPRLELRNLRGSSGVGVSYG